MPVALVVRKELLDRGEHDPARFHPESGAQVGPAGGLHRRLAQQVGAAREGAEELVVEVVAVGQHDDGGILHRRLADDAPGVEGHGQTLARPLRVPDDADSPVARRSSRLAARLVAPGRLARRVRPPLQLRRAQRLGDRGLHRVELVVAGHLLGERTAAVVLEHDEVADQGQEPAGRTDALDQHLELRHVRVGQRLAADRAPRLEPLPAGGQRADARLQPVRHDERRVEGEQRRDLRLVGLQLAERRPERGFPAGGVLQLDDGQRQAVEEQHHVRAPLPPVLHDGELIDGQPVVGVVGVEVDHAGLPAAHGPVLVTVFHVHAVDNQAVERAGR